MTPYSWISERSRQTHPLNSRADKTFAMLRAYLDDSGSHSNAHHCLVAGYWGGENEWRRFERAWRLELDREHIEEFHAKIFWQRRDGQRLGDYRDWSDERHRNFIDRLLKIIQGHKIYPLGCGVVMDEWNTQSSHYRRVFTSAAISRKKITEKDLNPILLPFQVCVVRAARYCHPGLMMHFVFDNDPRISMRATECFSYLKNLEVEAEDRKFVAGIGELTFADSRVAVPLQAADLLAYELYRYGKKRLKTMDEGAPMRIEAIRAISRFKTMEDFWLFDKDRFEGFKRLMETSHDKEH